jgi:hypothetical protein
VIKVGVNVGGNFIVDHHVNPVALERELGALEPWETVEEQR